MSAPLALDARLDSAGAAALAEALRLRAGGDLVLDASRVTLLGAKALQTILVARRAWTEAGLSLTVANLTPEALRQLADLGLPDPILVTGVAP